LSETSVYVNVTYHMTAILKVNMKNLEWDNCFCKCYISYDYCSQRKYEKSWVRQMFMWMLHHNMTVVLKVNIWKILSELNVYVNVTSQYHCCSQRKYEKSWVRQMFMWMLHHNMTVVLKVSEWKILSELNVYVNVTSQYHCCSQRKYEKSWVRQMFM
jgi:hypothetical protein